MDDTPRSLLDRLRRRPDAASWQRLVDLYTPFLRRILGRHGVPEADAEDLVQDVFGVVVREMEHFNHSGRRGAFRHWLYGILVNRMRGFWRGRQTSPQAATDPEVARRLEELEDPAGELNRLWDQEHNEHVLRRLLELLEPEFSLSTWQAFRRHVLEEIPTAQVAAELGLTANAVLIAKSRVLRRLREEGQHLVE